MTADFLLELLSEEIPARMQAGARNDLARMFADELERAGLSSEAIDVFSTPRRLALIARGLPTEIQARTEEVKGPRASAPPQAIDGFLRKTGLKRDQLEERDGVLFAVVETPGQPTRDLLGPMVERIVRDFPWPKSMRWGGASISTASLRWVRPLHGIVAMLGDDIVPVAIDGIESGATTVGHRFHHPGPITIGGPQDYAEKLQACHVIVDQEERERIIRDGAATAAKEAGLTIVADEGLVVENAGLASWPVPLLGRFDPDYLDVPREVIVLTMRANQKYFACMDESEGLAPAFICIANIDPKDGGQAIVDGNRRVLAARLADARFFWEQDLKVPLEEQAKKLSGIIFHEKLGTVADKVERVAKLARWLVEEGIVTASTRHSRESGNPAVVAGSGTPASAGVTKKELADLAERAARLAKADLVTGMVGEFPELQGVIGGYLAEAQGEPKAVADAIRDHYKPVGQWDEVPTAPVTVAVALADKLDTLVSFFAIDEKPTGSKDPFALRRAALGAIRLILQSHVRVSLMDVIRESRFGLVSTLAKNFGIVSITDETPFDRPVAVSPASPSRWDPGTVFAVSWDAEPETMITQDDTAYPAFSRDYLEETRLARVRVDALVDVVGDTLLYITDRIEEAERASGVRLDLIRAVVPKEYLSIDLHNIFTTDVPRERGPGVYRARKRNWRSSDDAVEILARVRALQDFVETGDGADLLTAYKRAANILKREKWESGNTSVTAADELQLEEAALVKALDKAERQATKAVEKEDFTGAMAALASLRGPIDAFFDTVTVNDPDSAKRARRLDLLMRFRDAVHRVADFSRIEG